MFEISVNECEPNPCLNGGSCTEEGDSYTCQCADSFTGDDCETDTSDCKPNNTD